MDIDNRVAAIFGTTKLLSSAVLIHVNLKNTVIAY